MTTYLEFLLFDIHQPIIIIIIVALYQSTVPLLHHNPPPDPAHASDQRLI